MVVKISLPAEYNPALFPTGKGITVTGQSVEFKGYTEAQVQEITQSFWRKSMPDGTNVTLKTLKKSKALTDDEIVPIKSRLPEGYDPKRHSIYKIGAANTKLDRDNDQFTPGYLQALAKSVNTHGAALLFNHNNDWLIGKVFYATTAAMEGADAMHTELIEYAIISPEATLPNQPNNSILKNIEDGILTDASIRFGRWRSEIKEVGGNYIRIIDTPEQGDVIHTETSLVFFPAQIGARLKLFSSNGQHEPFNFKSFNPTVITPQKKLMATDKSFQLGEKSFVIKAAQENETLTLAGDVTALETEIKSINAELPALRAASTELKAAKQPMINNIINLSGEKGLKKSYVPTEDELSAKTFEQLKAMETDLTAENAKANPGNQVKGAQGEEAKSFDPLSHI